MYIFYVCLSIQKYFFINTVQNQAVRQNIKSEISVESDVNFGFVNILRY